MIVPGSSSQALAAALAVEIDRPLATATYDRFPDGERLVSVPALVEAAPDSVLIVASTVSPADHIELLLLQDACRVAGVDDITTVIPYLGYARQDKAFEPGQPISIRAIARAIATGTDRVITVTPHEPDVCDHFTVPASAVDGADRLAVPLPTDLHRPVFLAPDGGATDIAQRVCDAVASDDATVDHFEKTRTSSTTVEIAPRDVDVTNRDVIIVDDIIATGTTMSEAIGVLRTRSPRRIMVSCVHPLFVGNARTKLAAAGVDRLIATDTIESVTTAVSVAPTIADALEDG